MWLRAGDPRAMDAPRGWKICRRFALGGRGFSRACVCVCVEAERARCVRRRWQRFGFHEGWKFPLAQKQKEGGGKREAQKRDEESGPAGEGSVCACDT